MKDLRILYPNYPLIHISQKNNADSEFVYHRIFNINGFVGIIEHWLNTGMEEDVEYLSDVILKFSYLENEK